MGKATRMGRGALEGLVALLLVQVVFGLFPLAIQVTCEGFTPRAIVAWRMAFGAATLGGLALAVHGRAGLPRRADLPRFLLCALLGLALNQLLAVEGLSRTTSVHAGLLMTLIPVFTYALATLARQERIRGRRALGIAVAMAGAVWLLLHRGGGGGGAGLLGRHGVGGLLIVGNTLCYAGFLVLAKPLLARYPPLAVIGWTSILALPAVAWIGRGETLLPAAPPVRALLGLAYTLLLPTTAHFLNTYALARVRASTTAVFIYLQPLVAGAAGVWLLGEDLAPATLAAALLLFLGIGMVVRRA